MCPVSIFFVSSTLLTNIRIFAVYAIILLSFSLSTPRDARIFSPDISGAEFTDGALLAQDDSTMIKKEMPIFKANFPI
jgi:hypothetical protein